MPSSTCGLNLPGGIWFDAHGPVQAIGGPGANLATGAPGGSHWGGVACVNYLDR